MTFLGTLKKLVAIGSKPNASTFPELLNVVVWMRCIMAVVYGIHLSKSTVGGVGMLYGLNAVAFVPMMYAFLLGADVNSYDNLIFAGVPNALALLLLVWIYFFTLDNASEEAAIANMISVMQTDTTWADEDSGGNTESASMQDAPQVDADSEF